jgi:hypothetical protein
MKTLVAWLLMRYQRAAFAGFALTVLSVLGVPATWLLVLLIIALSAAQLPRHQVLYIFAWISLPLLAAFYWQHSIPIILPLSQWALITVLAVAYRRGATCASIGYAMLLLAVGSLVAVYACFGDLTGFWTQLIQARLDSLAATTAWVLPAAYQAQLPVVAAMMTWVAAWTYFMLAFGVLIAAVLLLPGVSAAEKMKEFATFRADYLSWIVLAATAAGGYLAPLLKECLPFVLMPFLFGGLALAHAACRAKVGKQLGKVVLGCVYLLMVVLPGVIGLLLVLLAMIDSVFNLRRYIVWETSK